MIMKKKCVKHSTGDLIPEQSKDVWYYNDTE